MSEHEEEKKKISKPVWWTRELCALFVWSMVFVKVFFFDVDVVLVSAVSTSLVPLLQYKFFGFLVMVATTWALLGTHRFRRFVGYVIAYPFVIVLWKIPKHLIKNWEVALAFSPAIFSLIRTFKWSFISGSFAALSGVVIVVSGDQVYLWFAIGLVSFNLIRHYYLRFRSAFTPVTIFSKLAESIRKMWAKTGGKEFEEYFLDHNKHEPGSEEYQKARLQNLLTYYLLSSGFLLAAKAVTDVAKSRKLDAYLWTALLFTSVLTVGTYALVYLGLWKIDPSVFSGVGGGSIWGFVGYSFETMLPGTISTIAPSSTLTILLAYSEMFSAPLIGFIAVYVFMNIIRERHREDIDAVTSELSSSADSLGRLLADEFPTSRPQIEAILVAHYDDLVGFFQKRLPEGE